MNLAANPFKSLLNSRWLEVITDESVTAVILPMQNTCNRVASGKPTFSKHSLVFEDTSQTLPGRLSMGPLV